jgi:cell division inhibitor SepF
MRKMGVYLGLVEDDDWDADGYGSAALERSSGGRHEEYAETRYPRETNHARHHAEQSREVSRSRDYFDDRADRADRADRDPFDTATTHGRNDDFPAYQITTLHPRTYNEARTIGEHFRKHTPVIMNLTEMDDSDAKRLVDFAAGLTFGLHGRIERVTAKVFLLSPHNITVTAADKARIAETGFFNQS